MELAALKPHFTEFSFIQQTLLSSLWPPAGRGRQSTAGGQSDKTGNSDEIRRLPLGPWTPF